jgi:hypothetical protein
MSVKVAVRVRPFNEREQKQNPQCCVEMEGPLTLLRDPKGGDNINPSGERKFTFDYSFWSHDAFEDDQEGYSRPTNPNSKYADQS